MIAHELNMMGVAEGELSTIQDTCSILLNISGSVPPLGVILSFYRSLMGIRSPVSPLGPVQKFEEWIVHRIQTIPWHDKVSDLFRDPKKRAMRLALFTDLVLSRMKYERHLSFLDVKDFIALESLPEGEGDTEDLCREYETLVSLGKSCSVLLKEDDLPVIKHADTFKKKSHRMSFILFGEEMTSLEKTLPQRFRRRKTRENQTAMASENRYPVGGYSNVTKAEDIESIMSSEFVFMAPELSDLFEIRWVSGELLRYLRDESISSRKERHIHFELDSSTTRGEFLWVVIMIRKLRSWLGQSSLHFSMTAPEVPERDFVSFLVEGLTLSMNRVTDLVSFKHEPTSVSEAIIYSAKVNPREVLRELAEV